MSRHRRPVTLTVKQREQKLAFCIVVGAALVLLAGWGLVWWSPGWLMARSASCTSSPSSRVGCWA